MGYAKQPTAGVGEAGGGYSRRPVRRLFARQQDARDRRPVEAGETVGREQSASTAPDWVPGLNVDRRRGVFAGWDQARDLRRESKSAVIRVPVFARIGTVARPAGLSCLAGLLPRWAAAGLSGGKSVHLHLGPGAPGKAPDAQRP